VQVVPESPSVMPCCTLYPCFTSADNEGVLVSVAPLYDAIYQQSVGPRADAHGNRELVAEAIPEPDVAITVGGDGE
jgi:hypothetical protein